MSESRRQRSVEPSVAEVRVSIVGAAGYTGGEALRLLLGHPRSRWPRSPPRASAASPSTARTPTCAELTALTFVGREELAPCDVLFLCLPHGEAAASIDRYLELAPLVVDLSADFRLRDPAHLRSAGTGIPTRARSCSAASSTACPSCIARNSVAPPAISGTGCMATAAILGLHPLVAVG